MHELDGRAQPPMANGELVFESPRDPRLFGLARALCDRGLLEWETFRQALIAAIGRWEARPPEARGPYRYWDRFQEALEQVLEERGLLTRDEVGRRAEALAARPHGHDHARGADGAGYRGDA